MSRTRVVVTGLGTTSPLGGDVASTWDGLVNGRSGVEEADWLYRTIERALPTHSDDSSGVSGH